MMFTRRQFIQTAAGASLAYGSDSYARYSKDNQSTTFIIVADTHYSSVDENHPATLAMINAINKIADGKNKWPVKINDKKTPFSCAGEKILPPQGVIHLGDMTDFGQQTELDGGSKYFGLKTYQGFRQFWEHDRKIGAKTKIKYPVYCGLGNHDLDFLKVDRNRMLNYVKQRHFGEKAPVPVQDFDQGSHCYALHWGGVRILQLQRFANDVQYGRKSALPWLKMQLESAQKSQQQVLLCQHYGFDPFGLQDRWWTEDDRRQFLETIKPYSNIIGLCHGHSHAAGLYNYKKLSVFRCNNMGWELKKFNRDGYGSFALVHATKDHFNILHVDCVDAAGSFRFRPHYYTSVPL